MANSEIPAGWRVRAARALRNITVADLADRIGQPGLGARTLRKIEGLEREPRPMELRAVADACDLPYEFFTINFAMLPRLLGVLVVDPEKEWALASSRQADEAAYAGDIERRLAPIVKVLLADALALRAATPQRLEADDPARPEVEARLADLEARFQEVDSALAATEQAAREVEALRPAMEAALGELVKRKFELERAAIIAGVDQQEELQQMIADTELEHAMLMRLLITGPDSDMDREVLDRLDERVRRHQDQAKRPLAGGRLESPEGPHAGDDEGRGRGR